MALTRTVNLKMFAETAKAQAELDAIMAEAVKLGNLNPEIKPQIEKAAALKQMAVLRAELKAQGDKAGQDLGTAIDEGTKKGLGSRGGGRRAWIAEAIGLGAPLAGPLAAGGLAFGAFGLLAAGALKPVVTAMSGPGGLAAGWQTLNARQKTAAAGVEALKTRYDGLSKSMQPRAFQVFNTALSTANSMLGPLGKLASASGAGVEGFLVKFENNSGLQKFIGYASGVAPQAIGLLGTDVTTLVHSVLTLAQAAGGTGLFELRLLTGGLQVLDKVISVLPGPLEGVALGLGGVALAMSKIGILMPLLRFSSLASVAPRVKVAAASMATFAVATDGTAIAMGDATIASGGMAGAMAALDAVNPFVWVAAAVVGLGALAFWASKLKSAADHQVTSIQAQTKAQGFNTAGYFSAAKALGAASAAGDKQKVTLVNLHTGMVTGTAGVGDLTGATKTLTAAQQANVTAGENQTTFLGILEAKFGLTRGAAVTLAKSAGVLASQVDKGGQSLKDAVTQAEAFGSSMLGANNPTKTMNADLYVMGAVAARAASGVAKTNTAWDTFLSQSAAVETAELGIIGNLRQLDKDARKTGASFTGINAASITLQTDFESNLLPGISGLIVNLKNAHASTHDLATVISTDLKPAVDKGALANKGMRQQIFVMATEAGYTGPNKIHPLTAFIDKYSVSAAKALKLTDKVSAAMARIPRTEHTMITVDGKGQYSVQAIAAAGGHGGQNRLLGGAARGMFVSQGRPGVDDQLILAQRNELVVPAPIVKSGAVDHLRGKIPGFAAGGVVGSYSGGLGGLGGWVTKENSATLRAIESATAMSTLAGIKKAQAHSAATFAGGLGRASLRQIEDWWMAAGGPGGGTAHVAAAITGPESGFNVKAVQQGQPYATTGWGLWQITPGNSEPQAGVDQQLLTGPTNARAAVAKYRGAGGFSPWTTFESGAYLQYMAEGGIAKRGWTVMGEGGAPEMAYMHGGEQVVPLGRHKKPPPPKPPPPLTPRAAAAKAASALRSEQSTGLSLSAYYEHPGTDASIWAEERKFLRDIAKYFEGSSAKWRDAEIKRQTQHLTEIGTRISGVSARIASARSYQQSVRSGLAGYADLSTTTLGGSIVGGRKESGAQVLKSQLGSKLTNLRKFAAVLKKLSAHHVDSSLIRQVVALGPDDGTAYGEEILSGGAGLIRSLNRTESALNKTETQISRGAASAVYEGKYQPGKHFLRELEHERAGLEKLFRHLGSEMGREAAKWFRVPKRQRPKRMAGGGIIAEHIYGWGDSGQEYEFGERGDERVTPGTGMPAMRSGAMRAGPLITIGGDLVVREEADLGILSQKLGFAITRARL